MKPTKPTTCFDGKRHKWHITNRVGLGENYECKICRLVSGTGNTRKKIIIKEDNTVWHIALFTSVLVIFMVLILIIIKEVIL